MDKPLVSICIPTYNGEQFIVEAMESAITQTYSNLEIVVSDDASNDNTLQLIKQFREKSKISINIFHHQPNGIGANWNNCIKQSKGEYIKFLFQDDILYPTCIEEMVRVLEHDYRIGLVASKREFMVETSYVNEEINKWIQGFGDLQAALKLPLKNGMRILDKKLFKSDLFLEAPKNKVGEPSAVLFNKNVVKKTGYFREDLNQNLDYEFYYRILKKYKIAILEKELVKFRLHQQQATNVNKGNDDSDYVKYDEIIYYQYFWYLNRKKQLELLKRYNPIVKLYFKYNSISKVYRKVKMKLKTWLH